MASVFLYHVVGDLTVGKPELVEFAETETVEAAIRAIGESMEGGIPVWRKRSPHKSVIENAEMRQQRFVGILNSLDIVAFLARDEFLEDHDRAMKTPVSEVVVPNSSLLKEVDPATRLIDALEMMKQGVRRLLIPKSVVWKGMSKRFSILYNGKWLKNLDASSSFNTNRPSASSTTTIHGKFCCLSREDVIRFLIGCLGALAPLPLSSISFLGAINPNYYSIEASHPAIEAAQKLPHDPSAVAVVETTLDGQNKIIGEISACKLWKCDYLAAAWALANLSAGQFVMGVEDNVSSRSLPDLMVNPGVGDSCLVNGSGSMRLKKFSSRSIGFISTPNPSFGVGRSMYRGRSAPLTCKVTSSLAAVMAQMLSHRATHVWVTEAENEDVLVGVVGYADILAAVTRPPVVSVPGTTAAV
ncbi:CBS domain-containing protein CBSX6 [Camellia lanceoleosa]|uniref:CBS domain-containing protein CBSX6 n=1 Tax=Camellia lanceoleosa TaxID=1840588 RepID=A0ACC0H204_9ERIC|nr:CBS domain-containing protein CBSX6 [Camellia lanceoleosa]